MLINQTLVHGVYPIMVEFSPKARIFSDMSAAARLMGLLVIRSRTLLPDYTYTIPSLFAHHNTTRSCQRRWLRATTRAYIKKTTLNLSPWTSRVVPSCGAEVFCR